MKKIYSLLFAMLLAFVGAGSAWATVYGTGDVVNDYELQDDDIVCHGATIVINWDDFYGISVYSSTGAYVDYLGEDSNTIDAPSLSASFNVETQFVVFLDYDYGEIALTAIAQSSAEKIVEFAISLQEGNYCYASFYSSVAWEVPDAENIEVLVVDQIDGNEINLHSLDASAGDVVAGAIPVLIRTTRTGSVTINKSDATPNVTYSGTNYLVGSDGELTFSDKGNTYYILSKAGGVAGFYWQQGSERGDKVVNGAHKASLCVPDAQASNGFTFRFDDSVTAISGVKTQTAGTYYNLQGQRVGTNATGISIKNGQKFIVR